MLAWEMAKYLISAKRDIDSLLFIEENLQRIPVAIRRDYVDRLKDHFYINCCFVIDEYLQKKSIKGKDRTKWKEENCKIQQLYYERNKNSAHIDDNYKMKNYQSFKQLIDEMKLQIREINKLSVQGTQKQVLQATSTATS